MKMNGSRCFKAFILNSLKLKFTAMSERTITETTSIFSKLCCCISASIGNKRILFKDIEKDEPEKGKFLLPDELKQIQGFPEDYKLSGDTGKQIKQIGNAVPPPLIEMIVRELLK